MSGAAAWERITGTLNAAQDRMSGTYYPAGKWSAVRQRKPSRPSTAPAPGSPSKNPDCARLAREYYDHCANKREREWNAVLSRATSLGCTELDPTRCFTLQFELDVPPIEEVVPPMTLIVRPPSDDRP
jgi:hypothetical protein